MATTVITKSSLNVTRGIGTATVVAANSYAEVDYIATMPATFGGITNTNAPSFPDLVIKRTFGPGQAIPASFTIPVVSYNSGSTFSTADITYTISTGVEFSNT